jgi:glycosyltransferase involved in cell wall biosynthesis
MPAPPNLQSLKQMTDVTIVITVSAGSAALARTLMSIQAASPQPAEVMVVFDGKSSAVLADLKAWPQVRTVHFDASRSIFAARNRGLQHVTTGHVMFLNADDTISPSLLGHLSWTARTDRADIAFASHAIEQPNGKLAMVQPSKLHDARELLEFWLSGKYLPACSMLWNVHFLRHLGGWDESLTQNHDGDVILRALYGGARISWSRAGYGIYVQRNASTRVSRFLSPQAIHSQFEVLERVERMNAETGLVPEAEVGKAWYLLARRLYASNEADHAATALKRARDLGFQGHAGTLAQRITAHIFGLERKYRLANRIRKLLAS